MRAVRVEGNEAGRRRGPGRPAFLAALAGAAVLAVLLLGERTDEPDAGEILREEARREGPGGFRA